MIEADILSSELLQAQSDIEIGWQSIVRMGFLENVEGMNRADLVSEVLRPFIKGLAVLQVDGKIHSVAMRESFSADMATQEAGDGFGGDSRLVVAKIIEKQIGTATGLNQEQSKLLSKIQGGRDFDLVMSGDPRDVLGQIFTIFPYLDGLHAHNSVWETEETSLGASRLASLVRAMGLESSVLLLRSLFVGGPVVDGVEKINKGNV